MREQEVDCFSRALDCDRSQIHVFDLLSGVPSVGVLDAVGIDADLETCDVVLTGEGRVDVQSSEGKLVHALASRAAAASSVAFVMQNPKPFSSTLLARMPSTVSSIVYGS